MCTLIYIEGIVLKKLACSSLYLSLSIRYVRLLGLDRPTLYNQLYTTLLLFILLAPLSM